MKRNRVSKGAVLLPLLSVSIPCAAKPANLLHLHQIVAVFAGGEHGFEQGFRPFGLVAVLQGGVVQVGGYRAGRRELGVIGGKVGFGEIRPLALARRGRDPSGTFLHNRIVFLVGDAADFPFHGLAVLYKPRRRGIFYILNRQRVLCQKYR